jgi:LysM repeat protein
MRKYHRPAMHRSPARYLAPLGLVAVVAAVAIVVGGGGGSKAKVTTRPAAASSHRRLHHTVLVRPNDSLSAISARTGVSVDQIELLNPTLDPNALHPGQRLRLRK